MHAFGKITLFFCAGAFMVAAHKTEISQMRGIGHAMPFTTLAFFIGSLSVIGLPPMGGLWSKWYLALGTLETGKLWLLGVLMVSSLLNVAYLLPIPFRGFFSSPEENPPLKSSHDHDSEHDHTHDQDRPKGIKEAPVACLIAIGVTSAGCLVLFFYPDPVYDLMRQIVAP
jgi:multicomponent Na+:H+ antiporter subunit D